MSPLATPAIDNEQLAPRSHAPASTASQSPFSPAAPAVPRVAALHGLLVDGQPLLTARLHCLPAPEPRFLLCKSLSMAAEIDIGFIYEHDRTRAPCCARSEVKSPINPQSNICCSYRCHFLLPPADHQPLDTLLLHQFPDSCLIPHGHATKDHQSRFK